MLTFLLRWRIGEIDVLRNEARLDAANEAQCGASGLVGHAPHLVNGGEVRDEVVGAQRMSEASSVGTFVIVQPELKLQPELASMTRNYLRNVQEWDAAYHVWLVIAKLIELVHERVESRQQRISVRHREDRKVDVAPFSSCFDDVVESRDELRLLGQLELLVVGVHPNEDALDGCLQVRSVEELTELKCAIQ